MSPTSGPPIPAGPGVAPGPGVAVAVAVAGERGDKAGWSLADWLAWQETLHVREIDLGLERSRQILDRLALPPPGRVIVTVAGTNGKGSSVAMLDAIYRAAGYRTGCYTSPHLLRYNERIRIDGVPAADEEIVAAFRQVEAARGQISLTYFEFGTLAAFCLLAAAQPDVAILEVGLGGRLDAVNLLDADLALLTTIDLDHTQWLGDTREQIGREKAGILRPDRPAVCSDPAPPASILECAARLGTPLSRLGQGYGFMVSAAGFDFWGSAGRFSSLPCPGLFGDYQYQNATGVLETVGLLQGRLPVTEAAVRQGLAGAFVAGRFQRFPGPVEVVLDVAHNPQGAVALTHCLRKVPAAGGTHFVVGMMRDKDIGKFLGECASLAASFWVAGLPVTRGAPPGQLAELLTDLKVTVPIHPHEQVAEAFASALRAAVPGDRVVVTGSFLTVAEGLRCLEAAGRGAAGAVGAGGMGMGMGGMP
jgi:dihydrofolate synthase/folylpolyglutamate synthase